MFLRKHKLEMITGRVRTGFLYTQIRPVGLYPLPEPYQVNKWIFFFQTPNPARLAPRTPPILGPNPKS